MGAKVEVGQQVFRVDGVGDSRASAGAGPGARELGTVIGETWCEGLGGRHVRVGLLRRVVAQHQPAPLGPGCLPLLVIASSDHNEPQNAL